MKTRDVVIYTGKRFEVPQGIQRIDTRGTHGWQLRYGGTRLFSDGVDDPKHGAKTALAEATRELLRRIARLPAPSLLQRQPNANKTSDLPVGISGPIVRKRPGAKVYESSLLVLLPRVHGPAKRCTIYIGNENTYTEERFLNALERGIAMREAAEIVYRRESTMAKRAAGLRLAAKQAKRAGSRAA